MAVSFPFPQGTMKPDQFVPRLFAICCVIAAAFLCYRQTIEGFSAGNIVLAAFMIFFAVAAWLNARKRASDDLENDDRPLISIVLLLSEPLYLEDGILAHLASDILGEPVGLASDQEADTNTGREAFVAGHPPIFIVHSQLGTFSVNNIDAPYFKDPDEVAESIPELRRRKAVQSHAAWLSVDLLSRHDEGADPHKTYAIIGSLVAELAERAGDSCLAVFVPESSVIETWNQEMAAQLRSGDPLAGMIETAQPPVVGVSGDDPRLVAAAEEARQRWPEFLAALEKRTDDEHFAVKAPLTSGGNTEFIWISVLGTHGDVIFGTIDNDPVDLPEFKAGDQVDVELPDLNDWIFSRGDQVEGGFTIKVLQEIQNEQARTTR